MHQNVKEQPTYSRMMASLVDQVKKAVDEKGAAVTDRLESYIEEVVEHRKKVEGLQKELFVKLDELEKEDKRHITSDDIHTGFDYSNVSALQEERPGPATKAETGPKGNGSRGCSEERRVCRAVESYSSEAGSSQAHRHWPVIRSRCRH